MNDIFDKFFGGKFDAFGDIFSSTISQPNKKSKTQYEKPPEYNYTTSEKKSDGFILKIPVPHCKLQDLTLNFNSHSNTFTVTGTSSENDYIDKEFKIHKQLNHITNMGIKNNILSVYFHIKDKNSIPIYLET